MRKRTVSLTLLAALALPDPAPAALLERLGGAAYYDNVLGITWLADANLADSNAFGVTGINASGRMSFATANAWIAGMNDAGHLGIDNWRLPTLSPVDGSTFDTAISNNATTDLGHAKTTTDGSDGGWRDGDGVPVSEMGYMYYVNLASLGLCTPNDTDPVPCVPQPGFGLGNTADFVNLHPGVYWSGAEASSSNAWYFDFDSGEQNTFSKSLDMFAWAVRSGDVGAAAPVPGPGTMVLLGVGLMGLAGGRLRAPGTGASAL